MSNEMQELGNFVPAIKETQRLLNEQGQEVTEQKKKTENAIEGMSTDGDETLENIKINAKQQAKDISKFYAQKFKEQYEQATEKTDKKLQEGTSFQQTVEKNITAVSPETGNSDFDGVLEQAQQKLENVKNETDKIVEDMQETKARLEQDAQKTYEELTS